MSSEEDSRPLEEEGYLADADEASLESLSEDPARAAGLPPSGGSGGLVPADPFRRYLMQVRAFPDLDAEEERELALRSRDGDQEATTRLITANLKLVVRVARMYNRVYSNLMDLIQEGNIGLLEAVRRFDPFKGARLPTYATWWIKAYIIKYLIDNFRIVRVGTTNERRKLLFNLRKEKESLRLQGIEPTHQLIAERLSVPIEDVREIDQTIEGGDLSLDSTPPGETHTPLSERLEATEVMIDDQLARGELKESFHRHLQEFSQTLNERENTILNERLIAESPMTLQEIADRYGVTREAIRLNEKALIEKIKEYMEEALQGVTRIEFDLIG